MVFVRYPEAERRARFREKAGNLSVELANLDNARIIGKISIGSNVLDDVVWLKPKSRIEQFPQMRTLGGGQVMVTVLGSYSL